MTIWNVSAIYYGDNKVRFSVLPNDLKSIVYNYLKYDKVSRLIIFLINSRLTEKSARRYANRRLKKYNKKLKEK